MNMLAPLVAPRRQRRLPPTAPLAMPVRGLDHAGAGPGLAAPPGLARRRLTVFGLTAAVVLGLCGAMAAGLLRDGPRLADAVLLGLYVPNIAWTAFAAATAACGLFWGAARRPGPGADWRPRRRTAVLIPARNEDIPELAARIAALRADLARLPYGQAFDIFVLSDSDDRHAIAAERRMAAAFAADLGPGPAVYYRRRRRNTQRKPGNIAEWLRHWGGAYGYMLVLDADSRMTARRIGALVHRMETRPHLGLIQAGVRLVGADSRFGRLQQLATRLYGPAFAAGIAGWSGSEGNYWGHNALIRVRAFAAAAGLPRLSGPPPLGGDILSHDFVEAAWLRRAGWAVEIDPDNRGSAEGMPETIAAFHKRDRRWCQGNLQHMRLIFARGLHPVGRLHLACGIGSYLAAPLWLGLVVAATLLGGAGAVVLPGLAAMALILGQKLMGVLVWIRRRPAARWRLLRMALGEVAVSSLLAPAVMVRQSVAVAAVLAGRDCGWKPSGGRRDDDMTWLEPAAGLALVAAAVLPGPANAWQLLLVMPIALPLLAAPMLVPWLDRAPARIDDPAPQDAPELLQPAAAA